MDLAWLYRAYRYRFRLDPGEIAYLRRNLRTGDVAVDVGSHKGAYLYWMLRSVGKSGRVFGFEPQPPLFAYLEGLKASQKLETLELLPTALSDAVGEASMQLPDAAGVSSPGAHLGQNGSKAGMSFRVKTDTLDRFFADRSFRPDFLKIDAEGHEEAILRGGEDIIRTSRPRILLECEARHLSDRIPEDVFALLRDWGYRAWFFQGKQLRPIDEFRLEQHQASGPGAFWKQPGYVNNFVFEGRN